MERVAWFQWGILLAIALETAQVDAAKFLLTPLWMYSHINFFTIIGKALKDDGHEVWVLAHDEFRDDIIKRGLVPLTFQVKSEDNIFKRIEEEMAEKPDGEGVLGKVMADPWWGMSFSRVCNTIMQDEHIVTTIQRQEFDLVVHDGVDAVICQLMIPYRFGIPFVTVHGFQVTSWAAGVTGMPSIEPEFAKAFTNRMDFWQRLDNFKSWLSRYNNIFYDMYSPHMDKYCPPNKLKIPMKKLAEMSEMYLVTFEIMCLDYPRVSAPNLQFLGGLSAQPPKPLPNDLETYVADAEHGVVVMSFGTIKGAHGIWKMLGPKLFEAFSRMPQRIIVHYNHDELYSEVPDNVKLVKTWLPQNDLLANKNVQLYIGHGGNNGQNEAAYHGVPMLILPIYIEEYFDHMYNARRIEAHAYGKYVPDKKAVTSDELYQMMTEIINNKTYAENIKKCSEIIRSMPCAQEKFVFWVNHILRFGGAHLRPPSLDMPLYQVLMWDIVAYYIVYYLAIFHITIFALYFVLKYLKMKINLSRKHKSD